ncbi:MAG TPA: hypothetical protein VFA12_01755 [Stellaceae bacterium]|nr:hypothetical protein [Stellaceae bacterium]
MTLPFDAQLAALSEAVGRARDLAAAGQPLDLAGLDDAAAEICTAARAVPAGQRQEAAAALAMLGAGLDNLAAALAAGAPQLREGRSSRQARAGRAYGSQARK